MSDDSVYFFTENIFTGIKDPDNTSTGKDNFFSNKKEI
jgi:hypothetical protein